MDVTLFGCDLDEAALARERARFFGITPVITGEPVADATVALAAGSRTISVGHRSPVTEPLLAELSRHGVRYLSTRSIGTDHIDLDAAAHVGITVGNTLYSPDSVADFTLMLILMSLRQAASTMRRVDAHDYRLPAVRGRELRDLTVGVVGTGRIGVAVVARLRGFGCRILASDLRPKLEVEYVPLDELLRSSDVVTLHAPLTTATHHLLDRGRLRTMRDGALLVNTGRGGLVDTDALLAELESGRLGGAALDVLEGEGGLFDDQAHPPAPAGTLGRLLRLPNVLVTPHTAFFTDHALRDAVVNSLLNCLRFEKGLQHG